MNYWEQLQNTRPLLSIINLLLPWSRSGKVNSDTGYRPNSPSKSKCGDNYSGTSKTTAPAVPRSRTGRTIKVGVVQLPLPQSRSPEVGE